MDKEMQIRVALSYLGKTQAAESFEEAEENLKKHVELMTNLYNQDISNDRIAKGLVSALGQIILFYEHNDCLQDGLEYNIQACEIGKYLHEKNPQQLDLAVGYSMSCISISKTYLELEETNKLQEYFSIAKQLLEQLHIEYPDNDLVERYVQIKEELEEDVSLLIDEQNRDNDMREVHNMSLSELNAKQEKESGTHQKSDDGNLDFNELEKSFFEQYVQYAVGNFEHNKSEEELTKGKEEDKGGVPPGGWILALIFFGLFVWIIYKFVKNGLVNGLWSILIAAGVIVVASIGLNYLGLLDEWSIKSKKKFKRRLFIFVLIILAVGAYFGYNAIK